MKKILLAFSLLGIAQAQAQIATHVVISEIYGGGGNSGATYKNDFVELYNPTSSAISLNGWSIQYAATAGTSWQVTNLSGSIAPYSFFLIQEATGGTNGINLPTADVSGTINMAAANGKVALVNNNTAIASGTSCPTGSQIIDFVGFGTANCFEGTAATPAGSNTVSMERKSSVSATASSMNTGGADENLGNGYDANNNTSDFVAQSAVHPQNAASTAETPGSAPANTVSVAVGNTPAEPVTNGSFTVTLTTAAPVGGVTITYVLTGSATSGVDYTDPLAGTIVIPQGALSGTVALNVIDDTLTEGNETIVITLQSVDMSYSISSATATLSMVDNEVTITPIHTIQGNGNTATSGTYTVEGIVTAAYPLLSPAGFYMQEENEDADSDPNTSEGIFVVSGTAVSVGDKVRVSGAVMETSASPSFNQAVFSTATVSVIANSVSLPAVTDINLPLSNASDYEHYEGMLVRFPTTLTVTNNYTLGRFGEVGLSAGGLVYQPTQIVDVNDNTAGGTNSTGISNVAAINALITSNALRSILLDDGRNTTTTLPYADPTDNTLRLGSTITNLTGIMGYAFDVYRIQPVSSLPPVFSYAARPTVPDIGNADIRVASFNVLNYFNGDGLGAGFPTARGAHTAVEFGRQRNKIITAMLQMNVDVFGLMEMENDGIGANSAIQDLVNGLNAVAGANTYAMIDDGTNAQNFGTDEIRCGIIYKPAKVTPSGAAMLSSNTVFNRPPLAQKFSIVGSSQVFDFVVNHFKSKGCTGSSGADLDQADGQSCFNDRRKQQATALLAFFNSTVIPTSGTDRIISVGDYNAYFEEDPLDILRAGNYNVLSSSSAYSYQFDGQIGSLDHAVVSSSMNADITGIAKWNINAAEPVYLDYNDLVDDGGTDFANPFAYTYTNSAYRSSDHDPVLIGIQINSTPLAISLKDFRVVKNQSSALLSWNVIEENKIDNYIVERSVSGLEWKPLEEVLAKGGKTEAISYRTEDAAPEKGINLYRLKMIHSDGAVTYSMVRKLNFDLFADVNIYPNPALNVLNIDLNNSSSKIVMATITDVLGQQNIYKLKEQGTAGFQIDIKSLKPGVHCLKLTTEDGIVKPFSFVKY